MSSVLADHGYWINFFCINNSFFPTDRPQKSHKVTGNDNIFLLGFMGMFDWEEGLIPLAQSHGDNAQTKLIT